MDDSVVFVFENINNGNRIQRAEIVRLPFVWEGDAGWERTAYTPQSVPVGPDGKPNRGP